MLKSTLFSLFQVSWLRRHDDDTPHLLTFGLTTYSNDARIQVGEGWDSGLRETRSLNPVEIQVWNRTGIWELKGKTTVSFLRRSSTSSRTTGSCRSSTRRRRGTRASTSAWSPPTRPSSSARASPSSVSSVTYIV